MIKKIRHRLVWGYTLAIIAIMAFSSIIGIALLNYYVTAAMKNSLLPELEAEIVESGPALRAWRNGTKPEADITHFDSNELAFTVFEYWFSPDGDLLMAEGTREVSDMLLGLIQNWDYPDLKIREAGFFDDDGKEWVFIIIADNVYDDDGVVLGKVIVATNMTPLMKITRQSSITALIGIVLVSLVAFLVGNYFAAKAVKPIEVAMQKQRNFVADASHELRTPLSVLLASVDMLEPDNDEERQTVGYMRTEIMNMRNLIGSLLTLARSDNAKDALNFTDFDIGKVASDVVKGLQNLADTKNIKIILTQPAQKIVFYGDEGKIRQLLNILLDNAVKYSFENMAVLLNISAKSSQIKISVQDNGIGMTPQELNHIFERFYRADKSRSRAQGGFGLGLSIAQDIAATHQGEISVKSTPGLGSFFTVVLPMSQHAG